ncbi:MAG: 2-amino-4-hydroxy-6-hydroxymethyldihydropteridine diphosphokinase [Gammaproteobacteria bacterium]|nr:2-amino-4-hydroxy-6-hydroxymethyldihydropteridine diphosphokinase [Gammaproteobacteria bacterium]
MTLAAIAVGANLGRAHDNVARAMECVGALDATHLRARSSLYRSCAEGPPGQPDYINAVVLVETQLPPLALLDELQRLEQAFGRERAERWGPRTLDLDVLTYGDEVIADRRLAVPHPRAHRRSFVLKPLAEIAPDLVVPGHGPVARLLNDLPDANACRKLAAPQQAQDRAANATAAQAQDRPAHAAAPQAQDRPAHAAPAAPQRDDAAAANTRRGYFVIEGPVGVGKTSLARKLAGELSCRLVLEQVDDNPFLERFYRDIENMALPTQLYFLMSRLRQLREIRQSDLFAQTTVSDFLLDKDRLFARLTLDDRQFELYRRIYDALSAPQAQVAPDLVIYLQAPVEVLMRRIGKRGRRFERLVGEDYLRRLSAAYTDFFHYYDRAPLLIINTGGIDFVENESAWLQLKQRILSARGGRNYYNPLPDVLA